MLLLFFERARVRNTRVLVGSFGFLHIPCRTIGCSHIGRETDDTIGSCTPFDVHLGVIHTDTEHIGRHLAAPYALMHTVSTSMVFWYLIPFDGDVQFFSYRVRAPWIFNLWYCAQLKNVYEIINDESKCGHSNSSSSSQHPTTAATHTHRPNNSAKY